jgi:hypothetical protein
LRDSFCEGLILHESSYCLKDFQQGLILVRDTSMYIHGGHKSHGI